MVSASLAASLPLPPLRRGEDLFAGETVKTEDGKGRQLGGAVRRRLQR
jgi:hypothetical protein